jgi:hypothetical protein
MMVKMEDKDGGLSLGFHDGWVKDGFGLRGRLCMGLMVVVPMVSTATSSCGRSGENNIPLISSLRKKKLTHYPVDDATTMWGLCIYF